MKISVGRAGYILSAVCFQYTHIVTHYDFDIREALMFLFQASKAFGRPLVGLWSASGLGLHFKPMNRRTLHETGGSSEQTLSPPVWSYVGKMERHMCSNGTSALLVSIFTIYIIWHSWVLIQQAWKLMQLGASLARRLAPGGRAHPLNVARTCG